MSNEKHTRTKTSKILAEMLKSRHPLDLLGVDTSISVLANQYSDKKSSKAKYQTEDGRRALEQKILHTVAAAVAKDKNLQNLPQNFFQTKTSQTGTDIFNVQLPAHFTGTVLYPRIDSSNKLVKNKNNELLNDWLEFKDGNLVRGKIFAPDGKNGNSSVSMDMQERLERLQKKKTEPSLTESEPVYETLLPLTPQPTQSQPIYMEMNLRSETPRSASIKYVELDLPTPKKKKPLESAQNSEGQHITYSKVVQKEVIRMSEAETTSTRSSRRKLSSSRGRLSSQSSSIA